MNLRLRRRNDASNQQRHAHENPVIFYSVVIGTIGPVMVITVPPLRESWGHKPAQMVPTSYPRNDSSTLGCNAFLTKVTICSSQGTTDTCAGL